MFGFMQETARKAEHRKCDNKCKKLGSRIEICVELIEYGHGFFRRAG